jgi:hypothetical protein
MVTFRLTNTGSVTGTFGWDLEDDQGWLAQASPAPSGEVVLAPGGFQDVQATLAAPVGCSGQASGEVRFITRDLAIPGRTATCATTVSCSPVTGVEGSGSEMAFAAPYPNPSRGTFRFSFALPRTSRATLTVYDTDGRRVRVLADGALDPGPHERIWDGRDATGRRVGAGLYFAQLRAGGRTIERRVSVVP